MVQAYTVLVDIKNRENSGKKLKMKGCLLKGRVDWKFWPLTNAKQK